MTANAILAHHRMCLSKNKLFTDIAVKVRKMGFNEDIVQYVNTYVLDKRYGREYGEAFISYWKYHLEKTIREKTFAQLFVEGGGWKEIHSIYVRIARNELAG